MDAVGTVMFRKRTTARNGRRPLVGVVCGCCDDRMRSIVNEYFAGFFLLLSERVTAFLPVPVNGRRKAVFLFEKFDVVRSVGESALRSDVRDGFVGRYEEQPGMCQTPFEEPSVGRLVEVANEFFFKRSEAFVAQCCEFLRAESVEDVSLDDLLESFRGRVRIAQDTAFDAAFRIGNEQVNQFGGFEFLGGRFFAEDVVFQILVYVAEKVTDYVPGGTGYVRELALFFGVGTGRIDFQLVIDAQRRQDFPQVFGRIEEGDLFVGLSFFGYVFRVMGTDAQIEDVSLADFVARVTVVDVFPAAQHVAYRIARYGIYLYAYSLRL